jgi:two-component system nitrogen regulation sensor histidine kinase NtrY
MSFDHSTSKPPLLAQSDDKRKRRKKTLTIFWIIASLIGLTIVENLILRQQTSLPISNNMVVLVLFNIILILLFLLIVLITRNLIQLYNERKSNILGSKFQTKLIGAFLILALVPSILLFTVASKLFTFSIGSWFNVQVEQTLQGAMNVARDYYSHLEKLADHRVREIESIITRDQLYLQANHLELQILIQEKVKEYQLAGLVILDNKGDGVISQHAKDQETLGINYKTMIQKSIGGESFSEIHDSSKGLFLIMVEPLTQQMEGKVTIWGYILSLNSIPRPTFEKIESIRTIYEDYQQQSFLQLPVSASYYVTFLLITMLILFSAIWLGFYMARGITVPIQQLAEGTRRIAEGDLNFKINVNAGDEIGILVSSFNQMTDDLNEGRLKIQHAHEDLKLTNIELERRRSYIETILDNIGAGVISLNKKSRVTTFNKAAGKILNLKPNDVFGSTYKDAFDISFQIPIRNIIQNIQNHQNEFNEEQIELRVGDNNLTLLINIQILRDASNKYIGLVIVFEDLTQMIQTQKIAAWQEVAQGIAHEIKNPLTPIQLNTQRLKKKFKENKKDFAKVFDESISIISQEVEGMKDLLNEFVRFSRMPTPKPRMTYLHKIIDDVSILYGDQEKDIRVIKSLDSTVEKLNLDSEQIRRAFINLFENAIDAIEEKGEIHITTRVDEKRKVVLIEFADNGIGIDPKNLNKLFLPHFTTKKRGSGLGLAIVNRIIVDHNGTIQVQENHPRGTKILIELPLPSAYGEFRPKNFEKNNQRPA